MEYDVRIIGRTARAFRRSDGHDLGLVGRRGAIVAVSNGDVIAVLYGNGLVYRYDAETHRMLGTVGPRGVEAIAITQRVLAVVVGHIARYYEPRSGRQIVHADFERDGTPNRLRGTKLTAISKIRSLALDGAY